MSLVLDHCFILVRPGAPEAERLVAGGLIEGPGNRHPGQGTANRRFFFANGMLELLWLADPAEAENGPGRGLSFGERARASGASPFGLILRDAAGAGGTPPFDGWRYQPDYLPPPDAFHVGSNSGELREPLCIYMPFAPAPPTLDAESVNARRIERVRVGTPVRTGSRVLDRLAAVGGLEIATACEHLLEITLDGAGARDAVDFRPDLPLRLYA